MTPAVSPSGGGGSGGGSGGLGQDELGIYQSGTRIKMHVLSTADGAKQFAGWRDTQRNEDCTFQKTPPPDDRIRCLPGVGGYAYRYADPQCTVAVVEVTKCGNPPQAPAPPTYAWRYPASIACGGLPLTLHRVGAQVTPAALYAFDAQGACQSGGTPDEYRAYFGLDPSSIALTDFVEATDSVP